MRPELSHSFAVLGRTVSAASAPASLIAWLEEHWHFAEYQTPPHSCHIEIDSSATTRQRSDDPLVHGEAALADGALPFARHGDCWTFGDAVRGLDVEPGSDAARITVRGWGDAVERSLAIALQLALTEALRVSGLVPLHASVADGPRGATAFLGVSGTGKSTTLLHAAAQRARLIAEDLCWLDPASLTVFGWDRAVRVWPETLRRFFPDVSASAPTADGKVLVSYEALGASGARTARLKRLALLTRDEARRSGWEEVEPRAAVGALWEATGVPLSDGARHSVSLAAADLLRRLELGRLVLGEGPLPDLVS
ncbi:MAG: hypothetical protein ACHQU1_12205 [Gemmatimonadales bacterium]